MPPAPPNVLRGCLALSIYVLNTIFWTTILFVITLPKLALPIKSLQRMFTRISIMLANNWICVNNLNLRLVNRVRWDIQWASGLKRNAWYLLVANHQSWVDILVLQRAMFRKAPFLKFFLKKSLLWVPLLGQAWWVLDFPFLNRADKAKRGRKRRKRHRDLGAIDRSCQKFKLAPVTVMVFAEGTRHTAAKHHRQRSPYVHLLRPKAGGIARTIQAMGEHLDSILNVTIAYPQGVKTFWRFLCSKHEVIKVKVEKVALPSLPFGKGGHEVATQASLQEWMNGLWGEKDRLLGEMVP